MISLLSLHSNIWLGLGYGSFIIPAWTDVTINTSQFTCHHKELALIRCHQQQNPQICLALQFLNSSNPKPTCCRYTIYDAEYMGDIFGSLFKFHPGFLLPSCWPNQSTSCSNQPVGQDLIWITMTFIWIHLHQSKLNLKQIPSGLLLQKSTLSFPPHEAAAQNSHTMLNLSLIMNTMVYKAEKSLLFQISM